MTTGWNRRAKGAPLDATLLDAAQNRRGFAKSTLYLSRPLGLNALLAVAAIAMLAAIWGLSARAITLHVDGTTEVVRSHRADVGALLLDMGLEVDAADRVSPPLSTSLREADSVVVQRAHPFRIRSDGRVIDAKSWATTAGEALAGADLMVDAYDEVLVNGTRRSLDEPLPAPHLTALRTTYRRVDTWANRTVEPYDIRVVRAVPVTVDDGTLPFTVRTTAQTVGEALRQAEITIYLGDVVQPGLGSEVITGMRVTIQRSRPVAFEVDGRTVKTRTRGDTVSDALAQTKIGIAGMDRVEPGLETALYDGIDIRITRVSEEIEVEEEIAPFETVYVADANLTIDTQELMHAGAEGITRNRSRIRTENGEETARELEDTWVAQEPSERVIAYGQRIEPQTFTAPDGRQLTYWRKLRMYASSYSAGTAGVSPDKSYYGKTYTGETMRYGIVAVDPAIIPLGSQVYVSDYGVGDALDTGSAIRARRIDLGYDDSNLVLWNRWVDVYLMWPPPPAYQITWVLPNWPRPPQ